MNENESLIYELTRMIVPMQSCHCLSGEERKVLRLLEKVRDYLERLERMEDDFK